MAGLGPLETAAMEVLWRADEPLSVRQVLDRLNQDRCPLLAYTTVMTVLARLADKGALTRQPRGRGFAYRPTGSDPAALAVRSVLTEHGDAAIVRFVEQVGADPDALRRLRRLVDNSPGDSPETPP
ncbi:MAG: BlaI/MecI/CopY family transcriptional regulator [Streptosporangiales bacterium]|nr:BlaI/MecI/CopY family transcriptional regulator [Streptosporangiales bacterium]